MLEDFKGRQAKMNNIQSSIQSGDIKSGYVPALNTLILFLTVAAAFLPSWPGMRNPRLQAHALSQALLEHNRIEAAEIKTRSDEHPVWRGACRIIMPWGLILE